MSRTVSLTVIGYAAFASLLLAGCAAGPMSNSADDVAAPAPASEGTLVEASGMVIERSGGVAELCAGGVAQSLPPGCMSAIPLNGWDWDEVSAEEEQMGTRWGDYSVTGMWDGTTLTLTDVPQSYEPLTSNNMAPDGYFDPACATPDGGWVLLDPDRAGQDAINSTSGFASTLDGYTSLWIDTSANTSDGTPTTVVTVLTAGDQVATETALRQTWGGALCVAAAPLSLAELEAIRLTVADEFDAVSSGPIKAGLSVMVKFDDGSIQATLDERYGVGTVAVGSVLTPVDN